MVDWASHIRRILARLGEDVSWTPDGGSPATVRGVFLEAYQSVQLGSVEVSGAEPRFCAMSADLPAVAKDDQVVRGGVTYKVKALEPDTVGGFVVCVLEDQSA